eukprot:9037465-Pyramimonas_sp.AAC.1
MDVPTKGEEDGAGPMDHGDAIHPTEPHVPHRDTAKKIATPEEMQHLSRMLREGYSKEEKGAGHEVYTGSPPAIGSHAG